ncbi:MAG TPA: radical SAM protein [Anaerolineae bacterium]|nr:radical SAM protein [Anaerolineae bacterium]
MDCPYIPEISANDIFLRMRDKILGERIPLTGSIELTWRCNLRCAHCYITASSSYPRLAGDSAELSAAEFCRIIDEVAAEGCLSLLLTGGEPLLRSDFLDIYRHAKRRGILLILFTNGTLLTGEIVEELREWPPRRVEITLYGRTQETYERVTGVPGSHARCMAGIELLLGHEIPVQLKTMVMTLNRHELEAMQEFAHSLDVEFRFDALLNGCLDSSSAPLQYRLPPEEVVALDIADEERVRQWRAYFDRYSRMERNPNALFVCGAGLSSFHVDPVGRLSVCMMVRKYQYDLRGGSFRDGWRGHARDVRFRTLASDHGCNHCRLASLCTQCPGWSQLESGEDLAPIDYLCQVTQLRAEAVARQDAGEDCS